MHEQRLPLQLQWHGSAVRYRNIWIRPLDEYNRRDKGSDEFSTVFVDTNE
jgi:hypothetical protein